jgi:geranylgeranyl diphosphate synthase type I
MRDALAAWRPIVDEGITDLLPRTVDEEYLGQFFGEPTYGYDAAAIHDALSEPLWELLDRGGKRWRAVLCLVIIDALGADPEAYVPYAVIPEILHNGTIIVDDVEDDASMRRGEPALHLQYGVDIALNAGNAIYFLPLKVIARNPAGLDAEDRLAAYEMLMYELNRTHLGQGMDIAWHNKQAIDATEEQYYEMCACKTGALARITARLAAIVTEQDADVETELARYAENLALAFQIGDDILDVEHTLDQAGDFGKAFGNDVREGKKTLMVIHAAEHAPPEDAARLEAILWADENTDEEIIEAIEVLQSVGSVEYARERARELAAEARSRLDGLPLADGPEETLREFTRFVVERDM